jgi:predicted protein tyrosine phosphatase
MRKNLLFLCSRNKLRSPTAEAIFANHPALAVDSAGLSSDAEVPASLEQIEWADLILVMEPVHRRRLNQKFGRALAGKQVVVLDIPDRFEFMEPALVELLRQRCGRYL